MNMVGAPKHVAKALDAGVDLICAQGGEGGGHTGDVATSVLIPLVVDACRGAKSKMTGQPVHVIAAGGIFDGRGLAMALSLGAEAVWVGTRFVAATEAGASQVHKEKIVQATVHDTIRTTIYTGRPMRVLRTPFNADWEENRQNEVRELQSRGVIPVKDYEERVKKGELPVPSSDLIVQIRPWLMGQAAGAINDVKPAAEIIREMVSQAISILRSNAGKVGKAKL